MRLSFQVRRASEVHRTYKLMLRTSSGRSQFRPCALGKPGCDNHRRRWTKGRRGLSSMFVLSSCRQRLNM